MQTLPRLLADKLSRRPLASLLRCCPDKNEQQQQQQQHQLQRDDDEEMAAAEEFVKSCLNETFVEVNRDAPRSKALRGGSTASVALRINDKLFVANAGDSQTMLVRSTSNGGGENSDNDNNVQNEIMYRTRRDKPHLPDERARIEGMGGKIHVPPKFPAGSRVIVFSKAASPPEHIGLAMSRSIGDWEWKAVGVTAEPIVDVVDVSYVDKVVVNNNRTSSSSTVDDKNNIANGDNNSFLFLIAASDGVWDMRRPELFARRVGTAIRAQNLTSSFLSHLVLDVSPAKKEWYRDDMTIAAIKL